MKFQSRKVSKIKPLGVPALDRKKIVETALELLDEVGIESLTMRHLAKKLGIKAASLYWHVSGKHDLMRLMADEICAPMRAPARSLPWQDQLEALAHQYRRVLLAHRDGARVLASSGEPSGPNILRLSEIVLRTLLDAGFSSKDAAHAGFLLNDYVVMFVSEEAQFKGKSAHDGSSEAPSGEKDGFLALSPNDYPSVVALAEHLMGGDTDDRFRFGIKILRSGLETHLAKTGGAVPLK